jgi:hypothetical protein
MRTTFCKTLVAAAAVLAFGAAQAADNSLTFQGVTFQTTAVDSDTLQLTILNALSGGTGNWANINFLNAFELKDIGNVTGATLAGWTSSVDSGLSANAGCDTGGTPGACFVHTGGALALSDSMTFTIDFTGTNLDFSAPHLKVQFFQDAVQDKATGDLLSMTIPAVPEPETYALMLAGLGIMGFVASRRRQRR